jgi:hypothetical protein
MTIVELESAMNIFAAGGTALIAVITAFVGAAWKLSRTITKLTTSIDAQITASGKLEAAFMEERREGVDFRSFSRDKFKEHNHRIGRLEEYVTQIGKG